ncbi:MAG: antibiotic biosynthesis monooxygenase [Schleiferiaceae bacterium]
MNFRKDLEAPYYAVIFSSKAGSNREGYQEVDDKTLELAMTMPGYLGHESKSENGEGVFISYWKDLESIAHWRKNEFHQTAIQGGKSGWYAWYHSQVCKVERQQFFEYEEE